MTAVQAAADQAALIDDIGQAGRISEQLAQVDPPPGDGQVVMDPLIVKWK